MNHCVDESLIGIAWDQGSGKSCFKKNACAGSVGGLFVGEQKDC